jgi:hypothetical protein
LSSSAAVKMSNYRHRRDLPKAEKKQGRRGKEKGKEGAIWGRRRVRIG